MPEIIPEVGKKYLIKIDKNNIMFAIMSENDKINSFEYLNTGGWRGQSGTNYRFDCEIISEIV